MLIAVERTIEAIAVVVQVVPIGTNLALFHLLWVMVNGSFVQSRGAVFGALAANGLAADAVRRSWAALRYGRWEINALLWQWQLYVASQQQWCVRRYEHYQVLSVDITAFWRPYLQGWLGRHYHRLAEKLWPAVVVGVMIRSGQVNSQRIPLLCRVVRCQPPTKPPDFRRQLLQAAAAQATADQVIVVDAEFSLAELQAAGVAHYVVRLARYATARRNHLPAYKGRGIHPKYGEKVRPLPHRWRDHLLPATPPDHHGQFRYEGRCIQVSSWQHLVRVDTAVTAEAATFVVYLYQDPYYFHPLLLATNLRCQPQTAYLLYRDRWPVEQAPLAAKQMIGLHRQFVFAPDACFRLPELALLAGAILTYLAAVLPPVPSGFWDRTPKATPGRLRRLLAQADLPTLAAYDLELRKKNSFTAHLPKGIDAHRRTKRTA